MDTGLRGMGECRSWVGSRGLVQGAACGSAQGPAQASAGIYSQQTVLAPLSAPEVHCSATAVSASTLHLP